jgi:hypothetical protein
MTEPEIGVVCPTRDRPEACVEMLKSVLLTSKRARAILYVDNDQSGLYGKAMQNSGIRYATEYLDRTTIRRESGDPSERVIMHCGKRVGPVAASNHIINWYRAPLRIYGVVPDDCVFSVHGWDEYLIKTVDNMRNRIGVVSAPHNNHDYANFMWVSREWVDAVGWYFYPQNFHYCGDGIIELLGDCTNIVYAKKHEMMMEHEQRPSANNWHYKADATEFIRWCIDERHRVVERVLERMRA